MNYSVQSAGQRVYPSAQTGGDRKGGFSSFHYVDSFAIIVTQSHNTDQIQISGQEPFSFDHVDLYHPA